MSYSCQNTLTFIQLSGKDKDHISNLWHNSSSSLYFLKFSPKDMFIGFWERGRERGRETSMWYKLIICLSQHASTRDWTCNQGCSLTGNQTHNLFLYGTLFQPTDTPCQGSSLYFRWNWGTRWQTHMNKHIGFIEWDSKDLLCGNMSQTTLNIVLLRISNLRLCTSLKWV